MDVAAYKEFLNQPWGKLYYEILFAQLAHIKNKKGNNKITSTVSKEFPLSATTRQSRNVERYSKCSF